MSPLPEFIGTYMNNKHQIALCKAERWQTPTYQMILAAQGEEADAMPAPINRNISAHHDTMQPECYVIDRNPEDGAELIRLTAGYTGGVRSAVYLAVPGMNAAFEISVEPFPSRDEKNKIYYRAVRSRDDLNTYRHRRADRYHEDTDSYEDELGNMTKFASVDFEPIDWKKLNFYDMVRYGKIEYTGRKDKTDEYLVVTNTDPGPGMTDIRSIHVINLQDPTQDVHHELQPGRRVELDPLPDLSEIGIDVRDYGVISPNTIKRDVYNAVGSYTGTMQYVTPANYKRTTNDFTLRLA